MRKKMRYRYASYGLVIGVIVGMLSSPPIIGVTIPIGIAIGYMWDRKKN